jgi:DNA repair protein RadC
VREPIRALAGIAVAMSARMFDADVRHEPDEEPTTERLIAELLGRDPPRRSSPAMITVAERLLAAFGGIAGLASADASELEERLRRDDLPGGVNAARAISSAFELGRRVTIAERSPVARISGTEDAGAWGMSRLGPLAHEELWLLAIDGRSRLRASRCVAKGGLHGLGVRTADPLRAALRTAASGFVLVHNHPSGDPTPSPQDISFTREIEAAGAVIGVPLLDHVVVTRDGFVSIPLGEGSAG